MAEVREVVPTEAFGGFVSSIIALREKLAKEEGLLRKRLRDNPYDKKLEFSLMINVETQAGIQGIIRNAAFRRIQSMSPEEVDEYRRSKVMDVEVEMGFLEVDLAQLQKDMEERKLANDSLSDAYYEATGDKQTAIYEEISQNDRVIEACKGRITECKQKISRLESERKRMIALSDEEIKREFFDSHKMGQDYDELAKRDGKSLSVTEIGKRNLEKIVANISQNFDDAKSLADLVAAYNAAVDSKRGIYVSMPDRSYLPHDFDGEVSEKAIIDYGQTHRGLKNPQEVYEHASVLADTYRSNVERLKGKLDLVLVLIGTEKSGEVSKEVLEALDKLCSSEDSLFDRTDYKELEALALQKENVQNKKGLFAAFERFSGKQESELGDISTKIREVKKRIYPRIYKYLADTSFDYYGVKIPDFNLPYVPVHFHKEEAQRLVAELKEKLDDKVTKVDEFVKSMKKQAEMYATFEENAEKRVATCREAFFEFIKEHVQASSVSLETNVDSNRSKMAVISEPNGVKDKDVLMEMPYSFYNTGPETLTHSVKNYAKDGIIDVLGEEGQSEAKRASKEAQEELRAVNEALSQSSGDGNNTVGKSIEEAYQEYIDAEKRRREEQLAAIMEQESVDSPELTQGGSHK